MQLFSGPDASSALRLCTACCPLPHNMRRAHTFSELRGIHVETLTCRRCSDGFPDCGFQPIVFVGVSDLWCLPGCEIDSLGTKEIESHAVKFLICCR